jgi:hypothetical protein
MREEPGDPDMAERLMSLIEAMEKDYTNHERVTVYSMLLVEAFLENGRDPSWVESSINMFADSIRSRAAHYRRKENN